jgi:hypothetical protein
MLISFNEGRYEPLTLAQTSQVQRSGLPKVTSKDAFNSLSEAMEQKFVSSFFLVGKKQTTCFA